MNRYQTRTPKPIRQWGMTPRRTDRCRTLTKAEEAYIAEKTVELFLGNIKEEEAICDYDEDAADVLHDITNEIRSHCSRPETSNIRLVQPTDRSAQDLLRELDV